MNDVITSISILLLFGSVGLHVTNPILHSVRIRVCVIVFCPYITKKSDSLSLCLALIVISIKGERFAGDITMHKSCSFRLVKHSGKLAVNQQECSILVGILQILFPETNLCMHGAKSKNVVEICNCYHKLPPYYMVFPSLKYNKF